MKNWQFWSLLWTILVIWFVCISLLVDIKEDSDFINQNVVDMWRDVYMMKDIVDNTNLNVSRILLWCGESN